MPDPNHLIDQFYKNQSSKGVPWTEKRPAGVGHSAVTIRDFFESRRVSLEDPPESDQSMLDVVLKAMGW